MMPMIATTMSNSIRVKPLRRLRMWFLPEKGGTILKARAVPRLKVLFFNEIDSMIRSG